MRIIKTVVGIFVVLILIVVGILSLAGFIPGLSKLVGAQEPRDLGVAVTALDLDRAQSKLQQTFIPVSSIRTPSGILSGGSSTVDTELTSAEFAAHLQAVHPLTDLQIKFTATNGFEASGRIDKSRLINAVKLLGYSKVTETEALNAASRYLPNGGAFYIRGQGQITDGEITFSLAEASIGRLPVSPGGLEEALEQYAKTAMDRVPGLSIKNMSVSQERLQLIGSVPRQLPSFE